MKIIELFSGIGGFSKGFENAGYTIEEHYFSEIDKHAIANYKYNYPDAKYIGSVVDIRPEDFRGIDIITFGSPCQDFSLAGKRKGLEGKRSSLIEYAIKLITDVKPSIFIWENVKGAFSSNNSEDFWAILQAFTNIGGYRLEWQLLNTKWFLPQNRERIYLIGHLATDERNWEPIFPIGEDDKLLNKSKKYKREEREWFQATNFSGTITNNALMRNNDTFIQVKSATKKGYEVAENGDSINLSNPNSETRRGRVGKGVAQTLDCACNQAVMIGAFRGRNPENPTSRKSGLPTEQRLEINKEGVSNTLTSVQKDNVVVGTWRTYKDGNGFREIKENISPTIPARAREDGSGQPVIQKNQSIRRLTEIECERLQGFPDDWTKFGNYETSFFELNKKRRTVKEKLGVHEIASTNRYKLLGNAVTVRVVEEIAKRLKKQYDEK